MANKQDMPVAEKPFPTLGATDKEQDMARLARKVVPVGAFYDPSNPYTQSLSVNLALADAPLEHSEDYGADVLPSTHEASGVSDPMGAGAVTLEGGDLCTAEPADEDTATRAKELQSMKREELDSLAGQYGLDSDDYRTKDEIADAILKAEGGE